MRIKGQRIRSIEAAANPPKARMIGSLFEADLAGILNICLFDGPVEQRLDGSPYLVESL